MWSRIRVNDEQTGRHEEREKGQGDETRDEIREEWRGKERKWGEREREKRESVAC